ncbi:hypothetical protein SDC9_205582 [bioreactor metagenome]|uniref:Uncharacterized protein n=1 Tax=bioreactor metagenome TaxID=1076179 RepID=A0A645J368_9ZZZZ
MTMTADPTGALRVTSRLSGPSSFLILHVLWLKINSSKKDAPAPARAGINGQILLAAMSRSVAFGSEIEKGIRGADAPDGPDGPGAPSFLTGKLEFKG